MTEKKSLTWLKKNLKNGSILKRTYFYGIESKQNEKLREEARETFYNLNYEVENINSSSFEMKDVNWFGFVVKQKWPKAKDIRFTDNGFEVYDECGVPQNRKYQLWARYEIVQF